MKGIRKRTKQALKLKGSHAGRYTSAAGGWYKGSQQREMECRREAQDKIGVFLHRGELYHEKMKPTF